MASSPVTRYRHHGSALNRTVYYCDRNGNPTGVASAPTERSYGETYDALIVSQGNRAPYPRFSWNGGDFYKGSSWTQVNPASVSTFAPSTSSVRYRTEGLLFPSSVHVPNAKIPLRGWGLMRTLMVPMGSLGWNRFRPGKPVASISQFIGELRDLPKNPFRLAAAAVREARASRHGLGSSRSIGIMKRAVGEQYLNYSFGWRPFLADLEKIVDFDDNFNAAMRQLRRDHGRTIRRGGTIASDTTSTTPSITMSNAQSFMDYAWSSAPGPGVSLGTKTVTESTTRRFWFSAGFVYSLPREDDPDSLGRLRTYLKGGGISPSVVWELTPWSWLADYYTNIGAVIENWEASRELHLAARYCYVMCSEKYTKQIVTQTARTSSNGWSHNASASVSHGYELKARLWAGPYGLGFTSGSLNNSQIANLVALGLSRRI